MGLDMYLYKVTYIGGEFYGNDFLIDINIEDIKNGKRYDFDINKLSRISEDFGYWRKANQVHNWFVQNVQDGVDNCAEYYVSKDGLVELRNKCVEALKWKDKVLGSELTDEEEDEFESILPTQGGFFFGSTAYAEDYFDQLEDTVELLKDVEKYHDDWRVSFRYSSSW